MIRNTDYFLYGTNYKRKGETALKNEKKTNTYEKPEVEVIKLDKDASFMTQSTQTIGPIGGDDMTEE